jgi:hypothetical protein
VAAEVSHVTSAIRHKVKMTVRYFSLEQRKDELFLAAPRAADGRGAARGIRMISEVERPE